MQLDENPAMTDIAPAMAPDSQPIQSRTNRPTKPLRKHRGLLETRSLPVGAFQFSHQTPETAPITAPTTEDEEDWSVQPAFRASNFRLK
jgi:hypothetical protein